MPDRRRRDQQGNNRCAKGDLRGPPLRGGSLPLLFGDPFCVPDPVFLLLLFASFFLFRLVGALLPVISTSVDQRLNSRPSSAVSLRPGLIAPFEPIRAHLRRRLQKESFLVVGERLRLIQQGAPSEPVAEFLLQPAVLLGADPPPAADQRLVTDVDRRLVFDRLGS